MTSKYQKVPFDKSKMLKMKEIIAESNDTATEQTIKYSKLKLSVISGQLCFTTLEGLFMPIARITTIENIINK